MVKVVDIKFKFTKGNHYTMIRTKGNPGYTILNQYEYILKCDNGDTLIIDVKNDLGVKRVTKELRSKLSTDILAKIKSLLVGRNVDKKVKTRIVAVIKHWQNTQFREYDYEPYVSIDDDTLEEIKSVIKSDITN